MDKKSDLSRITVDIPKVYHRKLKAMAAFQGKSMREIIIESLEGHFKAPQEIPEHELWIYNPANKEIVEHIKEALKQKATIKRGSFAKYAK